MIVRMQKVYVVAHRRDRESLLKTLGALGVMHLVPIDPAKAVADEQTLSTIDRFGRAVQILSAVAPAGEKADLPPLDAAEQTLEIQRKNAERQSRLTSLYRQIKHLAIWGDVRLEQFEQLRQSGIEVQFYSVPHKTIGQVQADLVQIICELPGKRVLAAVVSRSGDLELPEQVEPVPLPARDAPDMRAEAAEVDATIKRDAERLRQLAHLTAQMQTERIKLQRQARFTIATRAGKSQEHLYALQGWLPAGTADDLSAGLASANVDAAVQAFEPSEEDQPPTLIRYPWWSRPIKGLFDILNTFPGYREYDLSPFFMIALPIFAAMLIGDAGYGLILLLLPLLLYRKITARLGKHSTHLMMLVGFTTLIWGILTANYFGITPKDIAKAGGFARLTEMNGASGLWAFVGTWMWRLGLLWRTDPDTARMLIIKVSFLMGCIHLTIAHLRRLIGYLPDQRSLAELGWCIILWGMLGIIWFLFFESLFVSVSFLAIVLAAGITLVITFGHPSRNPFKRIGIGLASSLMPLINTFGDTISYIRLMAVGLASYYVAAAFNSLGAMIAGPTPWLWAAAAPVVLIGHALNIALAMIAIFAHGVRLNMLEFSSNAGVEWAGKPYEPFAEQ